MNRTRRGTQAPLPDGSSQTGCSSASNRKQELTFNNRNPNWMVRRAFRSRSSSLEPGELRDAHGTRGSRCRRLTREDRLSNLLTRGNSLFKSFGRGGSCNLCRSCGFGRWGSSRLRGGCGIGFRRRVSGRICVRRHASDKRMCTQQAISFLHCGINGPLLVSLQ
jgi:hypothetical protein